MCYLRRTRPIAKIFLSPVGLLLSAGIPAAAQVKSGAVADGPIDLAGSTEIVVRGQLSDDVSLGGALGTRPHRDTPFSTSSASRSDLATGLVTNLADAFEGDASVTPIGRSSSVYASSLSVRGLPLDTANGYKINGLPMYNLGVRLPLEFFDRIDLLKGATGFLYGFGSPGGILNFISAKPPAKDRTLFEARFHSRGVLSSHIDIGRAVTEAFGYRLNGIMEGGKGPDGVSISNEGFALNAVANLGASLQGSFDGIYYRRRASGGLQGVSTGLYTDAFLPPPPAANGAPPVTDGNFLDARYLMLAADLRWSFTPLWTISASFSHAANERRYLFDFAYLLNLSGDYTNFVNDGMARNGFDQAQLVSQSDFHTGSVLHKLVVGTSTQRYVSFGNRNQRFLATGTTNIYHGTPVGYVTQVSPDIYKSGVIKQTSVFTSDTISFTEDLSVLAGARWAKYISAQYAQDRARTTLYSRNSLSPTIAALYKPNGSTMAYASYAEALEQGAIVPGIYANRDAVLAPLKSRQYEAGIKVSGPLWRGSVAVFLARRGAGYANSANEYVQDGYAAYRGLDANSDVYLLPSISIGTGFLWLDGVYRRSSADVAGNRVEGQPRFQATANLRYAIPRSDHLHVGVDVRHYGQVNTDNQNVVKTTSYNLISASVSYGVIAAGHLVNLRCRISNVFGQRYWAYVQPTFVSSGEPRQVSLDIEFVL